MNAASLIDFLQPKANAAAAEATNAALDTAAARPFNVVISLDQATRDWAAVMLMAGLVGLAILRRIK